MLRAGVPPLAGRRARGARGRAPGLVPVAFLGLVAVFALVLCAFAKSGTAAQSSASTVGAVPVSALSADDGDAGDAPCSGKGLTEPQGGARGDVLASAPSVNKAASEPVADLARGRELPPRVGGPAPPPALSVLRI